MEDYYDEEETEEEEEVEDRPWILFTGSDYYPFGGAEDFESSHLSKPSATSAAHHYLSLNPMSWAHVCRWDGQKFVDLEAFIKGPEDA